MTAPAFDLATTVRRPPDSAVLQAAARARFDVALVAVLSDAGLRRSEAAALTWGDVERWADSSGRITVIRSNTDVWQPREPWWPAPPPP